MISDKIDEQTHWLFNRTYGVSSKEQRKETGNKVKQQISEFGWEKTFESWKNYLLLSVKPLNRRSNLLICSGVMEVRTILSLNHINS